MADDAENPSGENNTEKKGSKRKLILLVVGFLLAIGVSVGVTFYVVGMMQPPEIEVAEDGELDEPEPSKKSAIYYSIKPPIIVNFMSRGRQRFLQAEVTLLTRDDAIISSIEQHMPMIRNELNFIIGGQAYEDIQTAEGKELLRQLCLKKIKSLLKKEAGLDSVEQVLFTNFVMQ